MSVQLVYGSGGSPLTGFVLENLLKEAAGFPERRFYVIVPEQYTLKTQKKLLNLSESRSIMNIEVLSFNRLALRVFEELGVSRMPVLEDIGKGFVLQKMILDNEESFGVLKNTLSRHGAANQLKSLISELMQYRYSPSDLEAWMEDSHTGMLLTEKLEDIRLVYEAFQNYLEEKYLTAEEVPEILGKVIEESAMMKGSTVVFDGFTGFVPTQFYVIRQLMKLCRKLTFTLTLGSGEKLFTTHGSSAFAISRKTAKTLAELAEETGTPLERTICTDRYSEKPDLAFLERNIFRYGGDVFDPVPEHIFLAEEDNPKSEMERIAAVIRRKIRQGGRYRDFAVITPDLKEYGLAAADVFSREGIPYFIDEKNDILSNILTEFCLAFFAIANENYSYSAVFRLLKTGLCSLSREETDLLETYVLARGIRGRKSYEKPWNRRVRTVSEEEMTTVNALRERFYEETEPFVREFAEKGITVTGRTLALYHFLTSRSVQLKLKREEEFFRSAGDADKAEEYERIYPAVCDFCDRLTEILGGEKVSSADYARIFEAGLNELKLGYIPPGQDKVIIGDLKRTRVDESKILFMTGFNEGLVPALAEKASLLSDRDREELKNRDIELAEDAKEDLNRQRFYLYLMFTKPEEELYISYASNGSGGESRLPSSVVGSLLRLFPKLSAAEEDTEKAFLNLESSSGRQKLLLQGLQQEMPEEIQPVFDSLFSYYLNDPQLKQSLLRLLSAFQYRMPETDISPETAELLYGRADSYSPGRLEQYASCAFAHFLKYGLKLNEREVCEFSAADFGSILHAAIASFSHLLENNGISWHEITEDERKKYAGMAFEEVLAEYGSKDMEETGSGRNLILRMKNMLDTALWAVCEQVKKSSLIPTDFELPFMLNGIRGIIDRVDICRDSDESILRVIDYKSGQNTLELDKLYYGIQLQLPLYLAAALELEKVRRKNTAAEPAGLYYFHIDDPFIEEKDLDAEVGEEAFLNLLKLKGLSRNEQEIISLLDNTLKPGGKSDVVQLALKKDGTPSEQGTFAASGEDFALLNRYTRYLVEKAEKEIRGGSACIRPVKMGEKTDSCRYCPYGAVCGYDEKIPGYGKRNLPGLKNAEALEHMSRKLQEGNNNGSELE